MATVKTVCDKCNGTGVYSGFSEYGGAAVICRECDGTGMKEIDYEPFSKKKKRDGIVRVFKCNTGIQISTNGGHSLDDFGGMPYEDWFQGKPFPPGSEMRLFACPHWWAYCDNSLEEPDWKECKKRPHTSYVATSYQKCPLFKQKERCWRRWDKEIESEKL